MVENKRSLVERVLVSDTTLPCPSGGEVNLRDGMRSEREGLGIGDLQVQ